MSTMTDVRYALKLEVSLRSVTPLLLRSGKAGDFTDSTIEKTPDEQEVLINGYVWASLLRRCLSRLQNGTSLADEVGSYHRQGDDQQILKGVSPLWCEHSTAKLHATTVNPGISIERQWGAAKSGALYQDELAMTGLPFTMRCTVFAPSEEIANQWRTALLEALSWVDSGVENIGGGWSYGFGRLAVKGVNSALLDLTRPTDRKNLWTWDNLTWRQESPSGRLPQSGGLATLITVNARVTEGQLLAIKSDTFPLDISTFGKLPDTFVFRRNRLGEDQALICNEPVIPGKAIRQALLSAPLERKWRTMRAADEPEICLSTTHGKKRSAENSCSCSRCRWFGSTDAAGILAVTDAPVINPAFEVVNRVQLCEHSMQNMNLFSGEYLTRGNFAFKIIIDHRPSSGADTLIREITGILDEMKVGNAPSGWHRLGGTATCTGQVTVVDYSITGS